MFTYGPNRVLTTGDSSYDTGPHNTQNKGMGRLWAILEQRAATGKKLLFQISTTPEGWGHHPTHLPGDTYRISGMSSLKLLSSSGVSL